MAENANAASRCTKTRVPIHVTDETFQQLVLDCATPVVVDFYADWCRPCRNFVPVLEEMAREFAGRLVVAKVNIDHNKRWAGELKVSGIPHLVYVHKGKVLKHSLGFVEPARLRVAFEAFLRNVEAAQ